MLLFLYKSLIFNIIFNSIMKSSINSFINFSINDFKIIDDDFFNNFLSSIPFLFKL